MDKAKSRERLLVKMEQGERSDRERRNGKMDCSCVEKIQFRVFRAKKTKRVEMGRMGPGKGEQYAYQF